MPDVTITIRRNGSLKVEGPIRLVDSNGQEMPVPADKPIISLCRCGHSKNKPFCDGSHKEAEFQGVEAHIQAAEAASA
jgi:CDGSH-type Zn-finger protein